MKIKIRKKSEIMRTLDYRRDLKGSCLCFPSTFDYYCGKEFYINRIDIRNGDTVCPYSYYLYDVGYFSPEWLEFESLEDELNMLLLYVMFRGRK